MRSSLLRHLVCPACRGELAEESQRQGGDFETETGALKCKGCDARYPIVRGIPRFVENAGYAESFSYQWTRFRDVQIDSKVGNNDSEKTLIETSGWKPADLKGKLVLDAGVGAGRFAEVAAAWGAEVVGVDLSNSVEAAQQNVARHAAAHVAQADIFRLPLRDQAFDFAYSIGVLDHTPDPARAFACVARTVKPGGQLAIYVYPDYLIGRRATDLIRRLTTRLPTAVNVAFAAVAIPLYYVHRLPIIGKLTYPLCPVSMHPYWKRRWLDTFDWYTPAYHWKMPYPTVYRWFQDAGFGDIQLFSDPIRMRGTKLPAQ